MDTKREDL
jgi:hypothetical protein